MTAPIPDTATGPVTALVTVTSRSFLPGTFVMLHSFLATNPWFNGEIAVIADDLSEEETAALARAFPRLACAPPSAALTGVIAALVAALPHLASRARRFHSLDAFAPGRAGRVLFCDSDLLFRQDMSAMLEPAGTLIACPDRTQLAGIQRDRHTLSENLSEQDAPADGPFRTFNAGLMVIDETLRSDAVFGALLGQLAPEVFAQVASGHTDQAVLNRQFGTEVMLADPRFNRLVGHAGRLRGAASVSLADAAVIHFNGPAKPWDFSCHPAPADADPAFIRALGLWFDAYRGFLEVQHFRARTAAPEALPGGAAKA